MKLPKLKHVSPPIETGSFLRPHCPRSSEQNSVNALGELNIQERTAIKQASY